MEIDNIFFFRKFQRPYELLIIFTIFCYIIYKINIWSIIYIIIIIIIIFYSQKKNNNIRAYYYLLIFLVYSSIFQSIVFVLNMNKNALPNMDEKISTMLKETLYIPLYENFHGKNYTIQNGVFFGIGISKSQVLLIWCENVLLFLIYLYLYYFSFNIPENEEDEFQKENLKSKKLPELNDELEVDNYRKDDDNNVKLINVKENIQVEEKEEVNNKKFNKVSIMHELLSIKDFRKDISHLYENEYMQISEIMKYNFNEKIISFQELNEIYNLLKPQENDQGDSKEDIIYNRNFISINSSDNSLYRINALNYILYLFFHNITLIIIIYILLICPGILSTILMGLCFYFLIFSHLDEGKKSKLPLVFKKCIIYFIIIDIALQLILQIFLIYNHDIINNKTTKVIFEIIGFREILDEKYEKIVILNI